MTTPQTPVDSTAAPAGRRARRTMLVVACLFVAPLLLAMLLQAAGWHPAGTRNAGALVQPPIALAETPPRDASGAALEWHAGERGFNLLVLAPEACAGDCAGLYDTLHRVWLTQGRHADRVRVLWAGILPAGAANYAGLVPVQADQALRARLPLQDGADAAMPLWLVDGRGYLALQYAPGFDPSGLRKDLARLLK